MTLKSLLLGLACALAVSTAQAGWFDRLQGNDTGGIIPWSPAIAQVYPQMAADHCASYSKIAFITSIHRVYGDYIAFVCAFPRDYDPVQARLAVPH